MEHVIRKGTRPEMTTIGDGKLAMNQHAPAAGPLGHAAAARTAPGTALAQDAQRITAAARDLAGPLRRGGRLLAPAARPRRSRRRARGGGVHPPRDRRQAGPCRRPLPVHRHTLHRRLAHPVPPPRLRLLGRPDRYPRRASSPPPGRRRRGARRARGPPAHSACSPSR